jgi:DNA-binding XRE family transcriptional regulator
MPKRNPVLAAFGQNVRKRRDAKAMTQEALAERAELNRTCISVIEEGTRHSPRWLSVAALQNCRSPEELSLGRPAASEQS